MTQVNGPSQWLQNLFTAPSSAPKPASTSSSPAQVSFPSAPAPSAAPKDQVRAMAAQGKSATHVSLGQDTTPTAKLQNIDSKAVFFDTNAVTAKEIDAILKHYGSPHAGKGAEMLAISQEEGVNPLMMLAIMQQESSYGNTSNNKSLKPENVANPWSVHFNEGAKGINKLRLKDGSMPSFAQSYRVAARTMVNLSDESSTPLTQAGKKYSTTASWTHSIKTHYATQLNRVAKMRP